MTLFGKDAKEKCFTGILLRNNKKLLKGEWKNGKFCGEEIRRERGNLLWEGEWKTKKWTGVGKCEWTDNSRKTWVYIGKDLKK